MRLLRRLLLWGTRAGGGATEDPLPWLASTEALPASMTGTRAGTALGLTGASWAAAVYTSHAENVMRFERLPSGNLGLLIEGARTNIAQRSQEIDDAYWTKNNSTINSTAITSPDGTGNAERWRESASGTTQYYIGKTGFISGAGAQSVSVFAKYSQRRWMNLNARIDSVYNFRTWVDLQNRVVGTVLNFTGGVIQFPNSWDRVWGSAAPTTNLTEIYFLACTGDNTTGNPNNASTVDTDIWQFQIEAGAFPSSPIPTTSASATRNAEATTKTITPPAGGFAVPFGFRTAPARSGNQFIASFHDTTANERIDLFVNSSGAVRLTVVDGGSTVADITGATVAVDTEHTCAISIAPDSIGLTVNEVAATRDTNTSGAIPTVTRMCFGHDRSSANHLFGHILFGPNGDDWPAPVDDSGLAALEAAWGSLL